MTMTKADRQEMMAKAREARKAKAETVSEMETVEPVATHIEYDLAPYEVVKEEHPKGVRLVLLLDGKHQAEWHGDEAECYERAAKFADEGDKTGAVDIRYEG